MRRVRTPQDKKAASLARDRRNTYGENDKSSRRAIRLRKRWRSRLARQALRRALESGQDDAEDAGLPVPAPRGQWRKHPDTPLGVLLQHRRLRRLARDLRARLADDPTVFDRLEAAAVAGGLDPTAARMIVRRLRADQLERRRDLPAIPEATLTLLHRLLRRLR
ncbi:MAG: hypothetical protein JNL82_25295 [Myxococcales bacterium]|nr:hypothetical protein [Myxococcales bacterium]